MKFLILGPLEVRNGVDAVRLGAAKQRALLAVLLLHANETVATSRLVDELWGERPPATAEKLVQGYVHALRKQLGDGVVETQAPGYRLRVAPGSLDLQEFEQLLDEARGARLPRSVELHRRALALWRGLPLADVELEGSERHNVSRLGELRLTTQIERIDLELQLGRHAQLVGELEALVAEHPYRERAVALLMLALYRSGRQAEALDVYRTVRRRLDDELGLEPGQELRELEAAILRQDESLRLPAREDPLAVVEEASTPTSAEAATRTRRLAIGGLAGAAAIAAVVAAAFLLRDEPAAVVVPPNSVAVIDPATNRVTRTLQTGIRPGPVAAAPGSIWVGNLDDSSLTRIDTAASAVAGTTPLPATPTALAVGGGSVWAMNARLGTLYRVHPQFETVDHAEFGVRSIRHAGAGADVGEGSVWIAYGESTLARVHPETLVGSAVPTAGAGPAGLVFAFGSVWITGSADATVRRFNPRTYELGDVRTVNVCRTPTGIAAGGGAIWAACTDDDTVARIPADFSSASYQPVAVGDGPTSVAVGAGAVWVANTAAGTVSRIDLDTNDVETIEVGNAPAGIAVSNGLVWVSVQSP
jgi:DNA-binding SARP family transcriptional activator/DNA-binding beta-propeller fold protein YncE